MKNLENVMESGGQPSADAVVVVVSEDGMIESMNLEALQLFQLQEEEYKGNSVKNLLPDLNVSVIEPGRVIHHYGVNKKGKRFPLFLRVQFFNLQAFGYYLLTLNPDSGESRAGIRPESAAGELLDMKYALDQAAIVAITDQTGKIKYVNDKFCEISQYNQDELLGQDHRIINSGYHSKAFIRNLWRTIANGKVWQGEIKNKAKDGSYYWVDTTIVPFLNTKGKPYQYLAIRQEITEHKRVVEELKKSMQELVDLKFALDESTIVAVTDAQGKIKYVNDQFCQVSKYSRSELLGQTHSIINSGYHPRSFFKELWQTIGQGEVWKGEIRNQAKDGTYYWVDTTIVPFLNSEGKPYQYLAIRSEITERKRVEEELKKTMSRIIEVQEEERKRLSRELHDGIGQNLYSHLITISRLKSESDHELIDQMLEEATELIEEVREISWELRPSVLDDLGLIPAIRSFLNRYSEHYDIDVFFECFLHNRLESAIEVTIYRIIQEALTNIRKYAEVEEASVIIREMDDIVRVMVEDKGKGFDPDSLAGGVGVISMEERAKSVAGELSISSKPGKGTKIIAEIPR